MVTNLEPEERGEKVERVVVETLIYYEGDRKFSAAKVPRQCPLVLLVGVTWREVKKERGRKWRV
jgi:hypothetical protein